MTGGSEGAAGITPKLFIFPHAGGAPQYYVPFAKTFTTDIKRTAVQYPGQRGKQDFASFTSLPALADEVVHDGLARERPRRARRCSSGTAWAACWRSRSPAGSRRPGDRSRRLFVSACAAPGQVGYDDIPETDDGLLAAVSTMTGASPEFMQNPEFAAAILPTLRGLKAIANYDCPPEVTLSCPIHAFYGDDDEIATADEGERPGRSGRPPASPRVSSRDTTSTSMTTSTTWCPTSSRRSGRFAASGDPERVWCSPHLPEVAVTCPEHTRAHRQSRALCGPRRCRQTWFLPGSQKKTRHEGAISANHLRATSRRTEHCFRPSSAEYSLTRQCTAMSNREPRN